MAAARRRIVSLRFASGLATMSGVEFSVVIPTIYAYIRRDIAGGGSMSDVTVLNVSLTLFSMMSIVVKPVVGWAVDRFAFRIVFSVLCVFGALGGAGYALAGSFVGVPLLFGARVVGGMALGCGVAAQSYAVYTLPDDERGPYLAVLSAASFILAACSAAFCAALSAAATLSRPLRFAMLLLSRSSS